MHYSMHHFAKRLGRGTFQMMTTHTMGEPLHGEWIHLSLLVDSEASAFPEVFSSLKNLRTLILLREPQMLLSNNKCKISRIPAEFFASMKYLCTLDLQYTMINKLPRTVENLLNLRYLNLSGTIITTLPRRTVGKLLNLRYLNLSETSITTLSRRTVGKLLNLRYLNVSRTDITTLPRCIGKLQNLVVLKLVNCKYLTRLNDGVTQLVNLEKLDLAGCHSLLRVPDRIDNMEQLRCFNIKDCSSMIQMPYRLGQFTNLHTLPRYIVGENDGYTIRELQHLSALEGELRVQNLQKVNSYSEAEYAELSMKTKIKSLTLQWKWWKHAEDRKDTEAIQKVLEELRPNKNVIILEIISYMGKHFPSWMSGMSPYLASLEEIKLFNLKGCQALPPLGVLPRLKIAEISGMDAVTEVDDEFYGGNGRFPSLQRLTFSQMLNLERWLDVDRRNVFPHLTNLTFIHCPKMVALWLNNERLYNSKGGLKCLAGSLKKLSISLCQKLLESSECEGLQELRALEEIEIFGCQELTNLPRGIRHLNFIKILTIVCCNKMMSSPNWSNDELTSLCSLSINGCNLLPINLSERN